MGNKLLEKQKKPPEKTRLWMTLTLRCLSWLEHTLTYTHTHTLSIASLSLSAPPPSHFPDLPVQGGWKETASPLEPWAELCRSELWIIVPQYECLWLIAWDKVCFPPHSSHLYSPLLFSPPSLPSSSSRACLPAWAPIISPDYWERETI